MLSVDAVQLRWTWLTPLPHSRHKISRHTWLSLAVLRPPESRGIPRFPPSQSSIDRWSPGRRIDPDPGAASNKVLCLRPCRSKPDLPFRSNVSCTGFNPAASNLDNVAGRPRLRIAAAQEIIKAVLSQIDAVVVGPQHKGQIESVNAGLRPTITPLNGPTLLIRTWEY